MTPQPRRASRIRRGTIGTLLTTTLAALSLPLATPATAAGSTPSLAAGTYLITLADQPLATYDGRVDDIPATRPTADRKLDVTTANAKRYRTHLTDEQTHVAKKVGATVRQHYAVTTNTFSAQLNAGQLVELARTKGVTGIAPDRLHQATGDKNSTDYLGLSGRKGLWAALGGTAKAGKGVVIGDIDTGIWPESASFKAPALTTKKPTGKPGKKPTGNDRYRPYLDGSTTVMHKADGTTFTGTCQTGASFTAADCNEKVISARYFGDGWLRNVPESNRAGYISPATAKATAPTPRRPRPGTPGSVPQPTASTSAPSPVSPPPPPSPSTRRSGRARTAPRTAASPAISSPPSTRPSPTEWT